MSGSIALNTIYSRLSDDILINDNLIITGNITVGGSLFNQQVSNLIATKLNITDFNITNTSNLNLISSKLDASVLNNYDSTLTVNSKLTNCIKYDPALAGPVFKTLNLSGLSLFDINGFNNAMEGMRQLIRCDIDGITAGYSSFTVLIDRLASSHIWASDRINLATATQIYTNSAETNFITATELQNVKSSSSNLQTQIDLKQPKFLYAARIFANGTISVNTGQLSITAGMINNSSTGVYIITLPTAHPSGANFIVMVSSCTSGGTLGLCTAMVNSSTQFTINVYNTAGSPISSAFCIHTIP